MRLQQQQAQLHQAEQQAQEEQLAQQHRAESLRLLQRQKEGLEWDLEQLERIRQLRHQWDMDRRLALQTCQQVAQTVQQLGQQSVVGLLAPAPGQVVLPRLCFRPNMQQGE